MKKLCILVAMTAAVALTVLTPATPQAAAQSGVQVDRRGDGPAWFDLVKIRGTNGPHRVRIALHVLDLQDRGRFEIGVKWSTQDLYYAFFVRVRSTPEGLRTHFRSTKADADTDPIWRCGRKHATVAWHSDTDRIVVTMPHGCLRRYDYYKHIDNWGVYGQIWREHEGELQIDTVQIPHLRRG